MNKIYRDKKILFGIILAFVFIASVSFTYAYFSAGITGNDTATDQIVTTGTLELTYTDGPQIEMNLIEPGNSISKTFSVKNTGTFDVYYKISWNDYVNTIQSNELVVSYTCKNYSTYLGEASASNLEDRTC